MFPNLNAEMARKKINIKTLAELAKIPYETLKNKCSGTTEFKRVEMFRIKKNVFPELSIDYLFSTEENTEVKGEIKRR